ncbi:hypothetical protein B566_EDAN004794 [Ephemera danica]|nr:hypothetical protein B566_EDAN004794 [Ephemera danica]
MLLFTRDSGSHKYRLTGERCENQSHFCCNMLRFIGLVVVSCLLALATSQGEIDWSQIKPKNKFVPGAGTIGDDVVPHITGGRQASRGQFPWQAALFIDNRGFCGGSLVTPTLILTAAHCTHGTRSILVFLGSHYVKQNLESTRAIFSSQKHGSHPNYRADNRVLDYDFSYVRLPTAATYNNFIKPIRLPKVANVAQTYEGFRARVSGWGTIADGSTSVSNVLKYADVTVISNTDCARTFGPAIKPSKICVATTGGSGPCNGDSGGPLVVQESDRNFTLVGVVSFGSARGCSIGAPAVFTRITSYLQDTFLTSQLQQY